MGKDEETDLIKFFVTSIKMAEKKQKWPLNVWIFDVHLSKPGEQDGCEGKTLADLGS
jgi:hypothetical protein